MTLRKTNVTQTNKKLEHKKKRTKRKKKNELLNGKILKRIRLDRKYSIINAMDRMRKIWNNINKINKRRT